MIAVVGGLFELGQGNCLSDEVGPENMHHFQPSHHENQKRSHRVQQLTLKRIQLQLLPPQQRHQRRVNTAITKQHIAATHPLNITNDIDNFQ